MGFIRSFIHSFKNTGCFQNHILLYYIENVYEHGMPLFTVIKEQWAKYYCQTKAFLTA